MPSYGSRYRVPLRRRREQKTDYQARKAFVVSHESLGWLREAA